MTLAQIGLMLDEIAKYPEITCTSIGSAVNTIKTSGDWATADSRTYTRTWTDRSDYHLLYESPCINAGVAVSGLTEDYAGHPVPYGLTPDIGIYEYGDGTAAGTPPTLPAAASVRRGTTYGYAGGILTGTLNVGYGL
jgi:hypothetical protein